MSTEEKNLGIVAHGVKCHSAPGVMEQIAKDYHISQTLIVPPNKSIVYTSGHTGYGPDRKLVEDIEGQTMKAFENVETSLKAAGVKDGWNAVFHMTTYHKSLDGPYMDAIDKAHSTFVTSENKPTWTGVVVKDLAEGAFLEIEVQALLD